jgi:hypothetical protein
MTKVRWISVRPGFRAEWLGIIRLRSGSWLLVLLAMAAIFYRQFGQRIFDDPKFMAAWILVLFVPVYAWQLVFPGWRECARFERFRIGASDTEAFFENAVDRSGPAAGHAPWSDVFFDDNRLLIGSRLLYLRAATPGRYSQGTFLFDEDELVRVVLSHVPNDNIDKPDVIDARDARQKWVFLLFLMIPIALVIWVLVRPYL